MNPRDTAPAIDVGKSDGIAIAFESRFARNGRGAPSDFVPPLKAQSGQSGKVADAPLVAFTTSEQANGFAWERDYYPSLDAQIPNDSSNIQKGIRHGMTVRRLTPTECERLQGFPDDWTAVSYRGKPAADGPRYRALGNSMAVPVLRWLLERVQRVEDSADQRRSAA